MGLIAIEGMKFYAFHGHYKVEQAVGNEFCVDLKIETNCTPASESDHLEDALNYQTAYEVVAHEMQITSNLLENVAKRILDSLYKTFHNIEMATVKVSKLNPSMGGEIEKVSVTLSR